MKRIDRNETWVKQEDGTTILVSVEEVEVDILTPEEEIAQKANSIRVIIRSPRSSFKI